VKISVVTGEIPDPDGSAPSRDLWAWCEGAIALGHELDCWSWHPTTIDRPLPTWCRWDPIDSGPSLTAHLRSLIRPRIEQALMGWEPALGAVAVADHVPSFPAVAHCERSVATLHFRTAMDALAVREFRLSDIQTARCEHRAGKQAKVVLAYSDRVARHLRRPATVVPIAYPVPEAVCSPVEEPVAALLADWSWRPNQVALRYLLKAWPSIRSSVPGSRLLLAGRNLKPESVGPIIGVEVLGEVGSSTEVLSRASVVAFPCPNSSGPKIKVIEALSFGVPVVTTPAGIEGVFGVLDGAVVSSYRNFSGALVAVLRSPDLRSGLAAGGRSAMIKFHSPVASARMRVEAFMQAFGE
jgi:hypothetical protein